MRFASLLAAAVVLLGFFSRAGAVVIDDFTEAPFVLLGSADLIPQTGLNEANVVGGARYVDFYRGPDAMSVAVEGGTLTAANPDPADDWGYFQIMYGYETPLNQDFTAGGHDRLRFRFDSVDPSGLDPFWVSVNTDLPPRSNAPGPNYQSLPPEGGVFEIPFDRYDIDFSNVTTFAIEVIRMGSLTGFALTDVRTAGPPLVGDYNRDGVVDLSDSDEWERFFRRQSNVAFSGLMGPDGNADGRVDAADYTIWRDAYEASFSAIETPEPHALVLAFLVAGVLATRRVV